MIKKEQLYHKVNEGLSISKIAKHFKCSNGSVRHWLKKYGFKTSASNNRGVKKKCSICDSELSGNKTKFCSVKCKSKAHYIKNKPNANSYHYQSIRGISRKMHYINKLGGGCEVCGYSENIAALEFHHIDETTKDMPLDVRRFANHSLMVLDKEVSKCVLLCSNCHREHHNPQSDMSSVQDLLDNFLGLTPEIK